MRVEGETSGRRSDMKAGLVSSLDQPTSFMGTKEIRNIGLYLGLVAVGVAVAFMYRTTFQALYLRWNADPSYSHGFLVPLFSLYLLWHRRAFYQLNSVGGWWLGSLLIGAGVALHTAAVWWFYPLLSAYSLLFIAFGTLLLAGGWNWLRWGWPAAGFLLFMIPLPGFVADALSSPLQRVATIASTYVVQLVGVPAFAEGNIIYLSEAQIGVVEACSGLRMLMLFFAMSAAIALLFNRPWWEKLIIVFSAVPIAIVANVTRITTTAMMHEWVSSKWADLVFHDLAGWFMMPLALGLMALEMWLLSRIFITIPDGPLLSSLVPQDAVGRNSAQRERKFSSPGLSTHISRVNGDRSDY